MDLYSQSSVVVILTYGLMRQLKKVVNKRFLPISSILLACTMAGIISYAFGGDWRQTVLSGLAGSAGSMAFHDTISSVKRKNKQE